MPIQLSVGVRNAQADAFETTTGTSARLQIRSGSVPSDCAAADAGTLLCEITLPSDWLTAASAGAKSRNGTWTGTAAAGGTAAHFRIKDSSGATCHMQGTVTATGGGGDMTLDNTSIGSGQSVTVNTFSYTRGNA
jgi:hypothetical protein